MHKVLFVCHGNICRSPMAEFVMKDMCKKADVQAHIESAAVSTEELGNPMYPPARRELDKHQIPHTPHCARQITQADLDGNDYVFYMDSNNARNLRRMFPGQSKWQPFLHRDVADPWYTGDFTQTWQDIVEGCQRILEECNG